MKNLSPAQLVPPNALPGLWHRSHGRPLPRRFVVLGAGKTAMDACIWLLQSGAPPEAIRWVVPRDSWLVNRVTTQNGPEFFDAAIGGQADQMEAVAKAESTDDLFLRLEACGAMLRIHPERTPGMFHFATVTPDEVQVLRRIDQVIRLGRVQSLHLDRMVLQQGHVLIEPDTLFIDCTASAIDTKAAQPIFQGATIVPQLVRVPLVAFSAALIAYVETRYADDAQKNRLCASVPFPHSPAAYPRTVMVNMQNQFQWSQDKTLREWIRASRLDGFGKLMAGADKQDAGKQAILARLKEQAGAAMANLPKLIAAGAA